MRRTPTARHISKLQHIGSQGRPSHVVLKVLYPRQQQQTAQHDVRRFHKLGKRTPCTNCTCTNADLETDKKPEAMKLACLLTTAFACLLLKAERN
jgi:hypothetical protein